MNKHHPNNERIKHNYLFFLKEAKGRSVNSVDAAAAALAQFEEYTKYKDFKKFHPKQASSFKDHLVKQKCRSTGKTLSKATISSTLNQLKGFFQWLSDKPGYKSRIHYFDANFFNLSDNDVRIANARRPRPVPTLQQVQYVVATMPATTDIERRNRALIAFTLLTGARDMAIASMKLKHVDLKNGSVLQDGRDVKTKFRKTFITHFVQVSGEVRKVFFDWVIHLRDTLLWGDDDPLFPSTRMELGPTLQFQAAGLDRKHWSTASPIRKIFRGAFADAGLPYFNPHSVRFTVARLGTQLCQSAEDIKAWSQNMGHAHVMTTLTSYGEVGEQRQGEIIRRLGSETGNGNDRVGVLAQALLREAMRLSASPSDSADQ